MVGKKKANFSLQSREEHLKLEGKRKLWFLILLPHGQEHGRHSSSSYLTEELSMPTANLAMTMPHFAQKEQMPSKPTRPGWRGIRLTLRPSSFVLALNLSYGHQSGIGSQQFCF